MKIFRLEFKKLSRTNVMSEYTPCLTHLFFNEGIRLSNERNAMQSTAQKADCIYAAFLLLQC